MLAEDFRATWIILTVWEEERRVVLEKITWVVKC